MTGSWIVWSPYRGGGKTGFITLKGYLHHRDDHRYVISNYFTEFSDDIIPSELVLIDDPSDCVLLLDELWTALDARLSGAGQTSNQRAVDFIQMMRKSGVDAYGTTQMFGMLDLRYRMTADFRAMCERIGAEGDRSARINVEIGIYDSRAKDFMASKPYHFTVSEVADLYDTKQVVERDRRAYIIGIIKRVQKYIKVNEDTQEEEFNLLKEIRKQSSSAMRKALLKYYMSVPTDAQQPILLELEKQSLI